MAILWNSSFSRAAFADGFVSLERLIPSQDIATALAGAFTQVGPPWARRTEQIARPRPFFPYDDDALNRLVLHPALIEAAEQLMGTRDIQLLTGYTMIRYSDLEHGTGMHVDYVNNTLGPALARDDFQHLSFFIHLDDVDAGHAPIQMVPNGHADSDARSITGPAGTVCAYSIYTRHSASRFSDPGHRVTMWVNVARKDRPWDQALRFDAHAAENAAILKRLIATATPRQLEFLGFPALGDPTWTPAFLRGMVERYPGFVPTPYQVATVAEAATMA